MPNRKIIGLLWARECRRPDFIPRGRPRGAKARGLRFERQAAAALPKAKHGLWFEFLDANGRGWCSPDLVLDLGDRVLVIEVKLTEKLAAKGKLKHLYFPVLSMAYGKPILGAVLARHLTPKSDLRFVVPSIAKALTQGGIPTIHWLGHGPLWGHL